jgi:hypothetical protein
MSSFKTAVRNAISKRFDTPVEEIDFSHIEVEIYKDSGDDEDMPDDGPIVIEICGYVVIAGKRQNCYIKFDFNSEEFLMMTQALELIIKG